MRKETKNFIVTLTYVCFTAFFAAMCICAGLNPVKTSESERRPLAQFPENITAEGLFDGSVIEKFDAFTVDQFPLREAFRGLKAKFQYQVLGLKENNGLALQDGYFAKITPEFTEGLVDGSVQRLSYVYEKKVTGKTYVCLIPDKNYYLGRDYGYPAPDYKGMAEKLQAALPGAEYVDIFDDLTLQSYYRTDTHWRQEMLASVAARLCDALDIPVGEDYTRHTLQGFKGVYYGQSALSPEPDDLVYLSNSTLVNCTVYDYETGKSTGIYDREKFAGNDGYDVFLGGTKALLRIDNPNAETLRELVVFRDSFASSLIPLLVQGYKSIYVVDIRYVSPDALSHYVDISEKDTLFIYSALILNQKAFK
ncbi:MAG: hypothetical protein IJD63_01610 [Oscillospiraceae bacterium]|nr:hypothetical protein [Oscillospiraceae bacterium]